jgi:hypothetical protein
MAEKSESRMAGVHPFLPILALVLLLMADLGVYYLGSEKANPEVALHAASIWTVAGMSFVFGGGLALWLRRFRLRFPVYFTWGSLAWILFAAFWSR